MDQDISPDDHIAVEEEEDDATERYAFEEYSLKTSHSPAIKEAQLMEDILLHSRLFRRFYKRVYGGLQCSEMLKPSSLSVILAREWATSAEGTQITFPKEV